MLTLKEIQDLMVELKDWSLESNSIIKDFSFNNFKESLDFVNKVGEIAEKQGHHPDIIINCDLVSPLIFANNLAYQIKIGFTSIPRAFTLYKFVASRQTLPSPQPSSKKFKFFFKFACFNI